MRGGVRGRGTRPITGGARQPCISARASGRDGHHLASNVREDHTTRRTDTPSGGEPRTAGTCRHVQNSITLTDLRRIEQRPCCHSELDVNGAGVGFPTRRDTVPHLRHPTYPPTLTARPGGRLGQRCQL
jgi:hypothetical protein